MTQPSPDSTAAIVLGLGTGAVASIFGDHGPSIAFLATLLVYAFAGATGRLFLDTAAGEYSARRQVGFVLVSVVTSFATAFVLWHAAGVNYPTVVMGWAIIMALLGPADAVALLQGVIERVLLGGKADKDG